MNFDILVEEERERESQSSSPQNRPRSPASGDTEWTMRDNDGNNATVLPKSIMRILFSCSNLPHLPLIDTLIAIIDRIRSNEVRRCSRRSVLVVVEHVVLVGLDERRVKVNSCRLAGGPEVQHNREEVSRESEGVLTLVEKN